MGYSSNGYTIDTLIVNSTTRTGVTPDVVVEIQYGSYPNASDTVSIITAGTRIVNCTTDVKITSFTHTTIPPNKTVILFVKQATTLPKKLYVNLMCH